MLMRRVGKLTAPASTFNSTLIWLWPNEEKEVLHSSQDRFFKDLLGALLPGRQVSILWPCEVINLWQPQRYFHLLDGVSNSDCARVEPGYSTVGALQDALENIVRMFSLLLEFRQ